MTEERIEEIWEEIRKLYERYEYGTIHIAFQEGTRLIRTVAAEAWEEGIEEMSDNLLERWFQPGDVISKFIRDVAKQLKEKGK